ncbi:MAG: GDP-mannose 4,6-dehydratase, partial [Chloroflexi bacterium]|nr:GDP-mannose 4,6-dehydratase [Chloroflexota bacterium]
GLINIGTGERITINRLASLISEVMGETLVPVYRGPRPGEVRHSIADISRARDLGFQPSHILEEGLRETIRAVSE